VNGAHISERWGLKVTGIIIGTEFYSEGTKVGII